MVFEQEQLYGAEQPVMRITVSQYISAQLDNDALSLINPVYKRIYSDYYKFRDEEIASVNSADEFGVDGMWKDLSQSEREDLLQQKILKHFINHPDSAVAKCVLNIIEDNYDSELRSTGGMEELPCSYSDSTSVKARGTCS